MKFELFLPKKFEKTNKTIKFLNEPNLIKQESLTRKIPFERSASVIMAPTLAAYKKSLLKKLIFGFFLFLSFILERIFHQAIQDEEIFLILKIQKIWFGKTSNIDDFNTFIYFLIGKLGEFRILFLLLTHFWITLYVGVDALIAMKIIYTSTLSIFILSLLSFVNSEERPYWTDSNIKAFYCDRTYSDPGIITFLGLFLIIYCYQCFNRKEEELLAISPFETSFSDSDEEGIINEKQKEWINRSLLILSFFLYLFILFMRFLMGLEYLINYFLSFIIFMIIYGLVISAEGFFETLIKQLTILKLYAKSQVFKWLIFLLIIEGLAWVIYNQTDYKLNTFYIQNYYSCVNNNTDVYPANYSFDEVLGKYETFQTTAIVFALIGLAFGASQTFRTISSMNWYKGPIKIRFLRIIIANIAIIPSWILITYQEDLVSLKLMGISNFMVDSLHYFILYYGLFGFIPVYIYLYYGWAFVDLKFSLVMTH